MKYIYCGETVDWKNNLTNFMSYTKFLFLGHYFLKSRNLKGIKRKHTHKYSHTAQSLPWEILIS
jgi:hypothetical protein